MKKELLHSCPELIDYINETGFLPLLSMGINGWSAEEVPVHPSARWWMGMATLGMERCHPAGKRLRIR
jgi:hypothetical protein